MIRHAWRALPWLVLLAGGALAVALMLVVSRWPYTLWPLQGIAVGLVAGTAAWCFDEPAAAVADTTPRHLAWRTAARSLGVLVLLSCWTLAVLLSRDALFGHAMDVWLQGVAGAIATSACVTWRRAHDVRSPGGRTCAVVVAVATYWALARPLTEQLPLFPYTASGPWPSSRLLWSVVAMVSVAVLFGTLSTRRRAGAARPVVLALTVVLGLVVACGESTKAAPAASPSPTTFTKLVDVGGHALSVRCQGTQHPTVVFEAGLGGSLGTFATVMALLPKNIRACAYDRAGIGGSQAGKTPRTVNAATLDLRALLDKLGEKPPYVMAGVSYGGLVTQTYAAQHPDDVSGIVLIDSVHPDQARTFERHLTPALIAGDRKEAQANEEHVDIYASFDQARAAGPLPKVPLVIITAGVKEPWPPGWDPVLFDRLQAELQKDLAARVPGGRQVIADKSGHNVPLDQPQVIVDAVMSMRG